MEKGNTSFKCKVNFAETKVDIKFTSKTEVEIVENNQTSEMQHNFFFLEKMGRITSVEGSMDDAVIQCKYDIPGGQGRSVGLTLSVWSLAEITAKVVEADGKTCKEGAVLVFKEVKSKSGDESNVMKRIKEKIETLTQANKGKVNRIGDKYEVDMTCSDFETA